MNLSNQFLKMFDFRLLIVFLLATVNLNSSLGKPFKIMDSFRFPRHSSMNTSESISSISKERPAKLPKSTAASKPTILPIIYPIVLSPNTMQYLTSSVISTPSGLTVDANSPISNIVKLIVNDSWTLNGLSSASGQTKLSPANQSNPPVNNLMNQNHFVAQGNLMSPSPLLVQSNLLNHLPNPSSLVSQSNLASAMSPNSIGPNLVNPANSPQQLNLLNLHNQITHHQNQLSALNQVSQLNQLIQLSEQLNRTSNRILKPMINDRLLLNQSQLNTRNDYDGFDYDTFLNKLGLSKELNFLDQFFKEESITEHPSKSDVRSHEPPNMQTANSLRNEFQVLNETHYPIFFHTDHYEPYRRPPLPSPPPLKVYSTYLFPVYSP